MSEYLIPEIRLSDFKALRTDQLRRLKCCVVTSDGDYLFTFVNPRTDYIKMQAENAGQLSNSVGGEEPEAVMGTQEVTSGIHKD